ncbi:P-loop containing nucleoside triphosphate hydrolase protein [Aspergillus egyptiacus]|nr:P-loop containing nucleoside triphosphate hydrolase protein [Aspergillus egyptiacus]
MEHHPNPKRRKLRAARDEKHNPTREAPQPVLVHRIICSAAGEHADHPARADYADAPRVYVSNKRVTKLGGNQGFAWAERRLKKSPEVDIMWVKHYSCDEYHSIREEGPELELRLEKLELELELRGKCRSRRPRYIPSVDAPEPEAVSEEVVIVSGELEEKVKRIIGAPPTRIATGSISPATERTVSRLYVYLRQNQWKSKKLDPQLLSYFAVIRTILKREFDDADYMFSRGFVARKHLPKLFWPGEHIVCIRGRHPGVYRVSDWPEFEGNFVFISCWSWEFDGRFCRKSHRLVLDWTYMHRDTPITQLDIHPVRFNNKLRNELKRRGQVFWACRQRRFVSYEPSGFVAVIPPRKSRYMVDAKLFHQLHPTPPNTTTHESCNREYLPETEYKTAFAQNKLNYLLFPPTIPAFDLDTDQWTCLSVRDIREIKWDPDPFSRLALEHTKKDLLRAFVSQNALPHANGLTLLLHGPSGTGKSFSAELVAELLRRPLYRIPCGGLGTTIPGVEKALEVAMRVGRAWGCVLLLDEVDVFLSRWTDPGRAQKNHPTPTPAVEAFFRVLESHPGLLIFTASDVSSLEQSVFIRSRRARLAVHYPVLDEVSRRGVWADSIAEFLRKERPHTKDRIAEISAGVGYLAEFGLNGWGIKNTLLAAGMLARGRGEDLWVGHLVEVVGGETGEEIAA